MSSIIARDKCFLVLDVVNMTMGLLEIMTLSPPVAMACILPGGMYVRARQGYLHLKYLVGLVQ